MQPLNKVEEDTDRDRYMSPLEAKEYGIIDHIIGGEEAVFDVKGSVKRFPKVWRILNIGQGMPGRGGSAVRAELVCTAVRASCSHAIRLKEVWNKSMQYGSGKEKVATWKCMKMHRMTL
eukprot:scaffold19808_cov23-Tisochrysis_lutea.AAC.3